MTCLSEFTRSVYADGELEAAESRKVARHLGTCLACRESVEALRIESRALVDCFQDVDFIEFELADETLNMPRTAGLSATRLVMFVLAMAALLRPAAAALAELNVPDTLGWLNPLSAGRQMNLLFATVMYGIPALWSMVDAFFRTATVIVFSLLLLFALGLLLRRSALTSALLSAIALLTVFSSSSYAVEVRHGDQPVTVPAGDTIDDTLVVAGDSVVVDGTINGNLIAFVERVQIRGTVKGNLVAFAERIEIEGIVEGSVLGCAGSIETQGTIRHDLYSLAGNVTIPEAGRIDGNALFLGGGSTLAGTVGKDFTAISARSTGLFRGVGRIGSFQVLRSARVGKNLTLRVDEEKNVRIDSGAAIGGTTNIRVPPPQPGKYSTARFYFWQTIWLAAALISGLVAFWLIPALGQVDLATSQALLTSAGIGFLVLVATPLAAVIAMLTLIGMPLGLITLAAWAVACYLAKIVIAGFLGRSMLANQGAAPVAALALFAGLVPVLVAVNLPYVGTLINLLLTLLGLGAVAMTVYRSRLSNQSA